MRPVLAPLPESGEARGGGGRKRWVRGSVALGAAAAVLTVAVETGWTPLRSADRSVSDRLHGTAVGHPGWTHANRVLTDWVWDPVTMRLVVLAVIVFLVLRRAFRLALWGAVTSAAGLAVQAGVKAAAARARPRFPDAVDSANGWAYPSGHVMTATVTCGLLVVLFPLLGGGSRRRAGTAAVRGAAVVSVAGVAFTRVYLGVHWPTDAVAGGLLGGAVVAACTAMFQPWRGTPVGGPRGGAPPVAGDGRGDGRTRPVAGDGPSAGVRRRGNGGTRRRPVNPKACGEPPEEYAPARHSDG